MPRPTPTYWSELDTLLPGRYRTRTRLTDCYVLQVAGQKSGHRHRAALYCLLLTGGMRRVWSRRFWLSNSLDEKTAKILALEILERELADRVTKYGRPFAGQGDLEESVKDLLAEIRAASGAPAAETA